MDKKNLKYSELARKLPVVQLQRFDENKNFNRLKRKLFYFNIAFYFPIFIYSVLRRKKEF